MNKWQEVKTGIFRKWSCLTLWSEFPFFVQKVVRHFCLINQCNSNMHLLHPSFNNFQQINVFYWHIESYLDYFSKRKKVSFFGQKFGTSGHSDIVETSVTMQLIYCMDCINWEHRNSANYLLPSEQFTTWFHKFRIPNSEFSLIFQPTKMSLGLVFLCQNNCSDWLTNW